MPHKPGRDAAKNADCKCNKLEASLHSPSSSYSIHYTEKPAAWRFARRWRAQCWQLLCWLRVSGVISLQCLAARWCRAGALGAHAPRVRASCRVCAQPLTHSAGRSGARAELSRRDFVPLGSDGSARMTALAKRQLDGLFAAAGVNYGMGAKKLKARQSMLAQVNALSSACMPTTRTLARQWTTMYCAHLCSRRHAGPRANIVREAPLGYRPRVLEEAGRCS